MIKVEFLSLEILKWNEDTFFSAVTKIVRGINHAASKESKREQLNVRYG